MRNRTGIDVGTNTRVVGLPKGVAIVQRPLGAGREGIACIAHGVSGGSCRLRGLQLGIVHATEGMHGLAYYMLKHCCRFPFHPCAAGGLLGKFRR